jgi:hypothetical protein
MPNTQYRPPMTTTSATSRDVSFLFIYLPFLPLFENCEAFYH